VIVPLGTEPFIIVLAGPNGAGKSTFYELFLEGVPAPFVNADRIARSVLHDRPASDYEAARIAEAERRRLVAERQSFIMETVFSDPVSDKVRFLEQAQRDGWFICLVYIGLDRPEISAARIAHRVRNGGHGVPLAKIIPRYRRSLANLRKALKFVDHAWLYDNSRTPYRRVTELARGRTLWRAADLPRWAMQALPR
jgi:predicted ABC-type ATPase